MIGKHKGNKYELLIYKDLRRFGECKRTIGSGSSDEVGDILFKNYAIECKHMKEIRWKQLTDFWHKLKKEISSQRSLGLKSMEPVIIYRINRQPIMVMCLVKYKGITTRGIINYNIWRQIIT